MAGMGRAGSRECRLRVLGGQERFSKQKLMLKHSAAAAAAENECHTMKATGRVSKEHPELGLLALRPPLMDHGRSSKNVIALHPDGSDWVLGSSEGRSGVGMT